MFSPIKNGLKEHSHEHSKHRCFLIDLASTSWCLDFACTVFTAVFGSESRHPKRSRIWQDGGTQIQARRGKHAENGSGSIYVWEQGKRNKQGERKKHWFWLHVLRIRRKYRREVQKTQRNLFGNPVWKLLVHTYTHTFYHSWQIAGTAHQKGAIKVWCVQSLKRLWPSHQLAATHCARVISWLPHTVRAEPRAACTVVQLARSSKKQVIAFPFQSDRRAVEVCCVQCPIFVQVCPSHQGRYPLYRRPAMLPTRYAADPHNVRRRQHLHERWSAQVLSLWYLKPPTTSTLPPRPSPATSLAAMFA